MSLQSAVGTHYGPPRRSLPHRRPRAKRSREGRQGYKPPCRSWRRRPSPEDGSVEATELREEVVVPDGVLYLLHSWGNLPHEYRLGVSGEVRVPARRTHPFGELDHRAAEPHQGAVEFPADVQDLANGGCIEERQAAQEVGCESRVSAPARLGNDDRPASTPSLTNSPALSSSMWWVSPLDAALASTPNSSAVISL